MGQSKKCVSFSLCRQVAQQSVNDNTNVLENECSLSRKRTNLRHNRNFRIVPKNLDNKKVNIAVKLHRAQLMHSQEILNVFTMLSKDFNL